MAADRVSSPTIAIMGAGFSGLAMAHYLRQTLPHAVITIFEAADDVGGTWYKNTYPGAYCDVMSHVYSFSFAPNPRWSEAWSSQAEIHAYLANTAAAQHITPLIRFGHRITSARWDAGASRWRISLSQRSASAGAPPIESVWEAAFFIAAPGALAVPHTCDVPGVETFRGAVWHSAQWRHDVPLAGKRVAVVGTGASAAQIIPAIAPTVSALTVVQRTPAWVIPRRSFRYPEWVKTAFAYVPLLMWLYRCVLFFTFDARFYAFIQPLCGMGRAVEKLGRVHLKRHVKDPVLREALMPHYALGCKRIVLSDDLYPALTRPNVTLVPSALTRFTPTGIVTADGGQHDVDVVVLANGFDVARSFPGVPFFGEGGVSLEAQWASTAGPTAYYGVTIPAFPNLYLLVGPNTGLGHNSIIAMIEAQAAYIAQCVERTVALGGDGGAATMAVKPSVCDAYNARLQEALTHRVWAGCASWYNAYGGKVRGAHTRMVVPQCALGGGADYLRSICVLFSPITARIVPHQRHHPPPPSFVPPFPP